MAVGIVGQPRNAALTAVISLPISTLPLPSVSKLGHCDNGARPRAMLTPRISSAMPTAPLASQSPTHCAHDGPAASIAQKKTPASLNAPAIAIVAPRSMARDQGIASLQ